MIGLLSYDTEFTRVDFFFRLVNVIIALHCCWVPKKKIKDNAASVFRRKEVRGVFRTLSNITDGAFCGKR